MFKNSSIKLWISIGFIVGFAPIRLYASSCMTDPDTKIKYEFDETAFSKLETQHPELFTRDIAPDDIATIANMGEFCKKVDSQLSLANVVAIASQPNVGPTPAGNPNCIRTPGVANANDARYNKLISDLRGFTADSDFKKIDLSQIEPQILTRFNQIKEEQEQRDLEKKERAGTAERAVKEVGIQTAKGLAFGPGSVASKYTSKAAASLLKKVDFAKLFTNQGRSTYKMEAFLPPNMTGIQLTGLADGLQQILTAPVSVIPLVGTICAAGSGAASLTLKTIALTKCKALDKRCLMMARANQPHHPPTEITNSTYKVTKEAGEEGFEFGADQAMEVIFEQVGDAFSEAAGNAMSQGVAVAGVWWGMMNGAKTIYKTLVSGYENGKGHEGLWALEKVYQEILDAKTKSNMAKMLNFMKETRSLASANAQDQDRIKELKKSAHCACKAMDWTKHFRRYSTEQFRRRDVYLRSIIKNKNINAKFLNKDRNKAEISDAQELISDMKDEIKDLNKEIEEIKQAYQKLGGDVSALNAQLAQLTDPVPPTQAERNRTEWYDHAKAWKDQLNAGFNNYNLVSQALYSKFQGKLQGNQKALSKLKAPAQCNPIQLQVFKQRSLGPSAAGNGAGVPVGGGNVGGAASGGAGAPAGGAGNAAAPAAVGNGVVAATGNGAPAAAGNNVQAVSPDDGKSQLKARTFRKDLDKEHEKLNDGKKLLKQVKEDLKAHPIATPTPTPTPRPAANP